MKDMDIVSLAIRFPDKAQYTKIIVMKDICDSYFLLRVFLLQCPIFYII